MRNDLSLHNLGILIGSQIAIVGKALMFSNFLLISFFSVFLIACVEKEDSSPGGTSTIQERLTVEEQSPGENDDAQEFNLELEWELGLEADSIIFGRVSAIDVDAEGRIFIADGDESRIRMYSQDGEYIESIGNHGQGPGEFEQLSDIVVGENDSLYAFDIQQGRISIFALGSEVKLASTVRIRDMMNLGTSLGIPRQIVSVPDGQLIIHFAEPNLPSTEDLDSRKGALARVDRNGVVNRNPIITVPRRQSFFMQMEGGGPMFTFMPFGRRSIFRAVPNDYFLYGWTDSLSVGLYTIEGEEVKRINHPKEPYPLREQAARDFMASAQAGTPFEGTGIADHSPIPDTWPVFSDFQLDDRGQLWVEMVVRDESNRSVWWVFDIDTGERMAHASIGRDLSIRAFKDGAVYSVGSGEHGQHTVVKHRVVD